MEDVVIINYGILLLPISTVWLFFTSLLNTLLELKLVSLSPFKIICPVPVVTGGFRGGSFKFHGEIYEKSDKMLKTNLLLMDLNPASRNPGSAPEYVT